jgi:hypothetical protein
MLILSPGRKMNLLMHFFNLTFLCLNWFQIHPAFYFVKIAVIPCHSLISCYLPVSHINKIISTDSREKLTCWEPRPFSHVAVVWAAHPDARRVIACKKMVQMYAFCVHKFIALLDAPKILENRPYRTRTCRCRYIERRLRSSIWWTYFFQSIDQYSDNHSKSRLHRERERGVFMNANAKTDPRANLNAWLADESLFPCCPLGVAPNNRKTENRK